MNHRLRIQNFKSIIDITVDLSPVTVLVGKSGTGKSNFVHALRFLRDILSSPQHAQAMQQKWAQLRPAMAPDGPTVFDVEFSIAGIEEKFRYGISIDKSGPQLPPIEEALFLGDKRLFSQVKRSGWIVEPELLQVPPAGPIALGRIPSISEVDGIRPRAIGPAGGTDRKSTRLNSSHT